MFETNKNVQFPSPNIFFNCPWNDWMKLNTNYNKDWAMVFGVSIWHIWKVKMKRCFQYKMRHSAFTFNRLTTDMVANFRAFHDKDKNQAPVMRVDQWKLPEAG